MENVRYFPSNSPTSSRHPERLQAPVRNGSLRNGGSIRNRLFPGVFSPGRRVRSAEENGAGQNNFDVFSQEGSTSLGPLSTRSDAYSQLSSSNNSPLSPSMQSSYPMPQFDNKLQSASVDSQSLQAVIEMFADIQALPIEEARDVWVAVNVTPTLPKVNAEAEDSFPLDVVIVVDTSSLTSHRLLDGLKTALENIYHQLLHPQDRFAILVTQEPKESWGKSKRAPHYSNFLGPPKVSTIKNALSRLKTPAAQRSFDKVGDTLSSAIEAALNLLKARCTDRAEVSTSFQHVIVISSNAHTVSNTELENEPIHILDLGILQNPHARTIFTSGWSLASSCLLSDQYGYHNDLDALDTFFQVARRNSRLARVENLILDIKPRPGYSIRGILGKLEHRVVVPGEKVIVMVRVRVPKWNSPDLVVSKLKSDRYIHELEAMLDIAVSDLFTVRLSFLQRGPSSLKKFNRSVVFYLNRTNKNTLFEAPSPQHPEPSFPLHPDQQFGKLHKRLAACAASSLAIPKAIKLLKQMLDKHDYDEEVLLKVQALLGELQSLSSTDGDRVSLNSQDKWLLDSPKVQSRCSTALGISRRSSEHDSTPASSETVIRKIKTLPEDPEGDESTMDSLHVPDQSIARSTLLGPRPMSAPGRRPRVQGHRRHVSSDKAQDIWRQMRFDSKPATNDEDEGSDA